MGFCVVFIKKEINDLRCNFHKMVISIWNRLIIQTITLFKILNDVAVCTLLDLKKKLNREMNEMERSCLAILEKALFYWILHLPHIFSWMWNTWHLFNFKMTCLLHLHKNWRKLEDSEIGITRERGKNVDAHRNEESLWHSQRYPTKVSTNINFLLFLSLQWESI